MIYFCVEIMFLFSCRFSFVQLYLIIILTNRIYIDFCTYVCMYSSFKSLKTDKDETDEDIEVVRVAFL